MFPSEEHSRCREKQVNDTVQQQEETKYSHRLFSLRLAIDSGNGMPFSLVQKSTSPRCDIIESLDRKRLWRPAPNNDGKLATLGFNSRSKIGPIRPHISKRCLGPMCGYLRSWNQI